MEQVILSELANVELQERARVLYACESGSRAWGFASQDSDYDVRFIYVRDPDWYLRLDGPRDVIEWKLDEVLDINGWDLQKALRLMRASNPTLFEWLSSPIVYRNQCDERLFDLAERSFDPKKSGWHYLSMASRNAADYLPHETVKLKKYLYVVRAILAARYAVELGTQPPMFFQELAEECLDQEVASAVEELLDIKRSGDEKLYVPHVVQLDNWIRRSLRNIEADLHAMPRVERLPWEAYNSLFVRIVTGEGDCAG